MEMGWNKNVIRWNGNENGMGWNGNWIEIDLGDKKWTIQHENGRAIEGDTSTQEVVEWE